MYNKKRWAAVGMAAVMTLGGCGAQEVPANTTAQSGGATETGRAENAGADIDTSEKIELRIMVQTTLDPDTIPVFQRIEEKYNVDLVWDTVESGYSEKKAVVLASNDLPDIFFAGLTENDVVANPELFVDLSELLDYAPNVQKMFEEVPLTKYISTYGEDGILSLPQVTGFNPQSWEVMMINKTWLDKLGLEEPTTLEELETVLKAFKEQDPNGNGKADEIPMDWPCDYGHGPYTLTGAYGLVDDKNKITLQDGKVDFLYTTDEWKKLTAYLHQLYEQGLINPEVYTTTDYQVASALSSEGDVARVGFTFGWSVESRTGKFADEYVVLPQLKADESIENPLWACGPKDRVNTGVACVLTKSCENPERAMMVINEFYSEDFALQEYYGSAPEFVEQQEDGTWIIKEPESGTIEEQKWKNALVNGGPCYTSEEQQSRTVLPKELQARLDQDNVYADQRPSQDQIFPSVKFDNEATEELTYLKTDIDKLVDQKAAEWAVNGGIEEEWDDYLDQLEKMGLSRMREIYQEAYDNWAEETQ
ncbi:MAG: extracellular solute-binding protein [Eubacteriales bacterium]|nr:extracellular solute-binding protein [Eubacteriales bacterium]